MGSLVLLGWCWEVVEPSRVGRSARFLGCWSLPSGMISTVPESPTTLFGSLNVRSLALKKKYRSHAVQPLALTIYSSTTSNILSFSVHFPSVGIRHVLLAEPFEKVIVRE